MGYVKGRFFTDKFELDRMNQIIRQQQEDFGVKINWWLLSAEVSDDTYDEPEDFGAAGRTWTGPISIPAMSVVPVQGADVSNDAGRYLLDTVDVRLQLSEVTESGLVPELTMNWEQHFGDRFQYRDHIYDAQSIRTEGHFDPDSHDVVVVVTGTQLRPDELVNDVQFAQWSA